MSKITKAFALHRADDDLIKNQFKEQKRPQEPVKNEDVANRNKMNEKGKIQLHSNNKNYSDGAKDEEENGKDHGDGPFFIVIPSFSFNS